MLRSVNLIILALILLCWQANSQETENIIKTKKKNSNFMADDLIEYENFDAALSLYLSLVDKDSTNSELNFKTGFCYLNTALEKDKAIFYFNRALRLILGEPKKSQVKKKTRKILSEEDFQDYNEVKFYLALAYKLNNKIDTAYSLFEEINADNAGKDPKFQSKLDIEINYCKNAFKLMKNPVKFDITDLGCKINSRFTDHSPIISADESMLIFTSRRPRSAGAIIDKDGQFDEDIYIVEKEHGNWLVPQNISDSINSNKYEASIALSIDGQDLYIYKDDNGDGNIYISHLNGDKWSVPNKLSDPINTRARETHASISPDGNRLYFTSDRKGGIGGMDIYVVRKLPNGEWGKPENLGPNINSPDDEEGPYIHPDGVTLYFSSNGNNSIGGYDIFYSQMSGESETFSEPVNLGYPINTVGNDVFFTPTANGKGAYYTSQRPDGCGNTDIYFLNLMDAKEKPITIVTGYMWICTGILPEVKITVYNAETDEVFGIYRPNQKTGKYLFVLNKGGRYIIDYESNGQVVQSEELEVGIESPFREIARTIIIKSGTNCDEQISIKEDADTSKSNNISPLEFDKIIKIDSAKSSLPQKLIDSSAVSKETRIKKIKTSKGVITHKDSIYTRTIEIRNMLIPSGVYFISQLNKELDTLSSYLNRNPEAIIEIGGHADTGGSDSINLIVSLKRAVAVKNYLLSRKVNEKQFVLKAYGESTPLVKDFSAKDQPIFEAQKYNRRIEIKSVRNGKEKLVVKEIQGIPEKYLIKK